MKNINPTKLKPGKHCFSIKQSLQILAFNNFTESACGSFLLIILSTFNDEILVDYSKNRITAKTMKLLHQLAAESGLSQAIEAMFTGEKINCTGVRAVLHTALRNRTNKPIYADGKDDVSSKYCISKNEIFRTSISGEWKGYTGKIITDVVNIGIGGSDSGPYMVTSSFASV